MAILIGLGNGIFNSGFFEFKKFEILGVEKELESRLAKKLESQIGKNLFEVNTDQVASTFMEDPWVDSVTIRKRFPDALSFQVEIKKPVAVLRKNDDFFLLDRRSQIISKANQLPESVPILMGREFIDKSDIRKLAIDIIQSLPSAGPLGRDSLSDVTFDSRSGFEFTLSSPRISIGLGHDNLPDKIHRARQVVRYLVQNKVAASHIDADFDKKVLVKVRKDR